MLPVVVDNLLVSGLELFWVSIAYFAKALRKCVPATVKMQNENPKSTHSKVYQAITQVI